MRNPYDIKKISGGSSSGSAAVVSVGLCPIALGVDGGGKEIHTLICLVNWLGKVLIYIFDWKLSWSPTFAAI